MYHAYYYSSAELELARRNAARGMTETSKVCSSIERELLDAIVARIEGTREYLSRSGMSDDALSYLAESVWDARRRAGIPDAVSASGADDTAARRGQTRYESYLASIARQGVQWG
jgi:hypothetical protein